MAISSCALSISSQLFLLYNHVFYCLVCLIQADMMEFLVKVSTGPLQQLEVRLLHRFYLVYSALHDTIRHGMSDILDFALAGAYASSVGPDGHQS